MQHLEILGSFLWGGLLCKSLQCHVIGVLLSAIWDAVPEKSRQVDVIQAAVRRTLALRRSIFII